MIGAISLSRSTISCTCASLSFRSLISVPRLSLDLPLLFQCLGDRVHKMKVWKIPKFIDLFPRHRCKFSGSEHAEAATRYTLRWRCVLWPQLVVYTAEHVI